MAKSNARNDASRASWLHLLAPLTGKYVTLGDIADALNLSSSTVKHNLLDLVEQKLIDERRFNTRRFIEITPKGEKLRNKHKVPPAPKNPYNRLVKQDEPEIAEPPVEPVKVDKSPYLDMHPNELKYINIFVTGTLNFLEDFEPGLQATSMQLRSAATMFKRALEFDQQQLELIMNDKRRKAQKKKILVRG